MPAPEIDAKLILEAAVSPSEDPSKVAAALGQVVSVSPGQVLVGLNSARLVTGEQGALQHFRDQLRDRHIRSAARRQMLVNRSGVSTSIMLNRQAAAAGVLAVCGGPEESPLGPIYLTISSKKLDATIDWLTGYEAGEATSRLSPS